jgi:signal transduction histidine kinase
VGAVLSAITGLFIVFLAILATTIALEAFHREQAAANTRAIVHIERTMLSAKQNVRNELAALGIVFDAPERAGVATSAHLFAIHATLNKSLASVISELNIYAPGSERDGLAEIIHRTDLYNDKFRQAISTLKNPGSQRDRILIAGWRMALTKLIDALNAEANTLSKHVPKTDAFVNEMAEVNELSWNVRVAAGNERRVLATATAEGRLSSAGQLKLSGMAGGIDSLWAVIQRDADQPSTPSALKTAVRHANEIYFTQFRALRQQVIAALAGGNGAKSSEQEWMKQSTPALNTIGDVSETALNLMEAHCEDLAKTGKMNFAAAVTLMLMSIGLASFAMFYIFRRVIHPLKLITRTMRDFAAETAQNKVPFTSRQDEIGDFARTLHGFRMGDLERQQLKSELVANQAEKKAADASSRMKTEFLANMSHELRTPLNAILGFSDIIRAEMFGPGAPKYRDYANDIHGAGNHLLSLINDILDIAKAESGKLTLYPEPVELESLIKECVSLVRGKASEKGLRIVLRQDHLPPLLIDRLRVKQILLNLLSNAVKFTETGTITVDTRRDADGRTAITVRDTGIGIEAAMIPLMFEPFQQVDSALSRKYEGTGLGLSLVKKLIELHEGDVQIESTLGHGTSASIRFPASRIVAARQDASA